MGYTRSGVYRKMWKRDEHAFSTWRFRQRRSPGGTHSAQLRVRDCELYKIRIVFVIYRIYSGACGIVSV